MHLARLVFLTVDVFPTPSKLEAEVFGLKVSSMCHWKKDRLSILLLKCEADVTGKLSRSDSNEVTFPQDIIQRVEGAIERTADLISVLRQSKRTITSPVPCIALIPKDEQERTWLEQGFYGRFIERMDLATSTVSLLLQPSYPDVQIDMAYFLPHLARSDGKQIRALAALPLDGKSWQQWSRHRVGADAWRPGVDNLETHLLYVTAFLECELKK